MALVGDAIDNVPGVKGIGDKTAAALIRHFGSVEELLARLPEVETLKTIRGARRVRETLEREAASARLSRELVRLRCDVPVEITLDDLRMQAPDYARLRALFIDLGFQSKLALVAPREPAKSGTTVFLMRNAASRLSIWVSARSKSCCMASSSFSRVDLYSGYISVRPESPASLIQMT